MLEDHPVLRVLAGGDAHRRDPAANDGVTQNVVRARRLFSPGDVVGRELLQPVNGCFDVPTLVRVDGQRHRWTDRLARDPAAAQVVFDIESDFELYGAKAFFDRPPRQPCELLVGVSEPTRRRRVRRITERIQRRNALRLAGCGRSQNRQRLGGREGVGNVAKVDQIDDLLGTHVGNQPPDGFPAVARGHIPGCVHDGADGHVHDALLGAQPAQLRVIRQASRKGAEVSYYLRDVSADDKMAQGRAGQGLYVVAPPDGKDEAIAAQPARVVGAQHHVRGRVIGVSVHGIRTVHFPRRRETDVVSLERRNHGHAGVRQLGLPPRSRR